MRTLLELAGIHDGLSETFARHRDFIVGLEFRKALDVLDEFEKRLRSHMEAEEAHVLPAFESRVGRVEGGDPELFRAEHRNLIRNLEAIKDAVRRLADNGTAGRRQAHECLHWESLFMSLLDHHDRRERNILYPMLDRALSDAEREAMLAACGLPARRL